MIATASTMFAGFRADAGTLSGGVVASQQFNVDLTSQGNIDWAVWGYANSGSSTSLAPNVRKASGSAISSLTNVSNGSALRGLGQFGNYGESTFNWTNGTPTPVASGAFTGLQHYSDGTNMAISAIGEGFSFTVPADTTATQLKMYFDTHLGISELSASLSDGSAPAFSQSFDSGGASNFAGILSLEFAANSAGQTLTVQGVLSSYRADATRNANFAIQAVTLGIVPEPSMFVLAGLGMIALSVAGRWRRRS
jgi:hypothetical protein